MKLSSIPLSELAKEGFTPANLRKLASLLYQPGPILDCLENYATQWEKDLEKNSSDLLMGLAIIRELTKTQQQDINVTVEAVRAAVDTESKQKEIEGRQLSQPEEVLRLMAQQMADNGWFIKINASQVGDHFSLSLGPKAGWALRKNNTVSQVKENNGE